MITFNKKLALAFFITSLFSGCEIVDTFIKKDTPAFIQTKEEYESKVALSKEIQLKKITLEMEKELALIASKKDLAKIEKKQELAKIKIEAELKKQKFIFDQSLAQKEFEFKLQESKRSDEMEMKRYGMLIIILLIFIISGSLLYYFKKRSENKLRAYNDNLQKYFNQKENETKMRITEKLLDAINSGKLNKKQESQLITAFSNSATEKNLTKTPHQKVTQEENEIIEVEYK